ncbi:MAG: hypothetical protein FVQ84_22090 [Planctomycetes bacterium]|nr:hypothetical protein [Planctomycetota bacterium]
MKRSGTVLIFVIVWAAVLFGSFVIGICVKEVRFHRAGAVIETKTDITPKVVKSKVEILSDAEKLAQELALQAPAPGPGGGERLANRPAGQGTEEGRGNMRERMANMSEEERAQMRERMGSRRRGGGDRMQNLSEEERAQMRARFENMSEEERAQMRERMGGRRPRGDGESGRGRPGGRQNREQQENN